MVWPEVSGVASRNKSSMGGKHMIVAAETWQPWFAIDEQPDGSLSYRHSVFSIPSLLRHRYWITFQRNHA